MRQITAREANQRFAKLLTTVEDGEEVVITKHGRPVAVISPYRAETSEERKQAIEEFLAILNEPIVTSDKIRRFSRDEMHER